MAACACDTVPVIMLMQFFRSIPAVCCIAMLPQIILYFTAQHFTAPEAGGLRES
ncbi:MAG: hypothetical protein IKI77_12355 [Oscillospiraceae bacterium]|nr:hypothetical protein [Oscillospiraceae bacterium]